MTSDCLCYYWSKSILGSEERRGGGMDSDSVQSTILIVDDDPAILEYAGEVLQECGYAVLTAPNGASALVLLRNNDRVDLLFTDLVMPGVDGVELARRAGQACRRDRCRAGPITDHRLPEFTVAAYSVTPSLQHRPAKRARPSRRQGVRRI